MKVVYIVMLWVCYLYIDHPSYPVLRGMLYVLQCAIES
jgi:hypothetical protein